MHAPSPLYLWSHAGGDEDPDTGKPTVIGSFALRSDGQVDGTNQHGSTLASQLAEKGLNYYDPKTGDWRPERVTAADGQDFLNALAQHVRGSYVWVSSQDTRDDTPWYY